MLIDRSKTSCAAVFILGALFAQPSPVLAQSAALPATLYRCKAVTNVLARLACYDDFMSGEPARIPNELPPDTPQNRFLTALKSKWVVDPGSESASVVVTVAFDLNRDGTVIAQSIKLVSATGSNNDSAIRAAFESVRRAILRASAGGFGFDPASYDQWKHAQITFTPNAMHLR